MGKENLAHFLVDKVVGKNQHVLLSAFGGAGTGKSMFAGALIIGMANYLGKRLKRDPREFFNYKDNLACINLDRVEAVMNAPSEYGILWLDDVGIALNARKFYKESSMDFNDILQSFRPNKNIVVLTTQYGFLIDRVPRTLSHYHVELTHKLFDTHNVPLSACKVFEVQHKQRSNETWYPFLRDDNGRYVQFVINKCPDVFLNEYDKIRSEEFKRMLQKKKETQEVQKSPKDPKQLKKQLIPFITKMVNSGKTLKESCEYYDVTDQYYHDVIRNEGKTKR